MATSGVLNSSAYKGRYVQFSWTATQSVANNQSTISWTLKGAGTATESGVTMYKAGGFKVVIDGDTVYSKSTDYRIELYNGTSIASGTKTITHNSDGSRKFSVSIQAGIYTYAVNCTGETSFTLDTIPRASTATMSTGTIGSSVVININKAASGFKHTLEYYFGNTSGTIVENLSSESYTWTPPKSIANELPNSTSGKGTLRCITYNNSTKVGQKDTEITLNVPSSMIPTIDKDKLKININNSANMDVEEWGIYLLGYSKANIVASASGSYGSTISSYTLSGGYSTTQNGTSLNYTGEKFTSAGNKTFYVVAKDSRGRSSEKVEVGTIKVYEYAKPSISTFKVSRSDDNSKQMVVKASWSYSSVDGKNSATATLNYKKASTNSWSTYGKINNGTTTLNIEFEETSSYNFELVVTDHLSNSEKKEALVSTLEVLMDFKAGGKGLGIGKIAESNSLEVGLQSKFYNNIYLHDDFEIRSLNAKGGSRSILKGISSEGNTILGYGNYTNADANTHIYGDDVKIWSNVAARKWLWHTQCHYP